VDKAGGIVEVKRTKDTHEIINCPALRALFRVTSDFHHDADLHTNWLVARLM
jgi:hypothetical protein